MFHVKHRRVSLLLALLLALGCLSPALAAEGTGFSDVPADAWYAPYVEVCVRAGVMGGTGDGRFQPERLISQSEGYVLLLRLYDVLHGGSGVFPAPPENWGTALLTFDDGTQFTLPIGNVTRVCSYTCYTEVFLSPQELSALDACAGQFPIITEPATGAAAAVTGISHDFLSDPPFHPYNVMLQTAGPDFDRSFSFSQASLCPDWYRRAAWFARTQGLWDGEAFPELSAFSFPLPLYELPPWAEVEPDDPLDDYTMSDDFGLTVLELTGNGPELRARLTQCGLSLDAGPSDHRVRTYSRISALTRAQAAVIAALALDPELPVVPVITAAGE